MNHPEIAKIGLGNVDMARLKKSIDILVDANALPRTPTVEEIFTPRVPAAGRRPAEEAVLRARPIRLLSARPGVGQTQGGRAQDPRKRTMDLKLEGRVAVITGPAKGMGAAITMAFAAEGRAARAGRPRHRGDRAGRRRSARGRCARRSWCPATSPTPSNASSAAAAANEAYGRIDILVNVAGGSGPDRQDRRRDHAGGVRRHRHAQHERLLPHHARRAADHDGAALRQDRQCRRHLRHARPRRAHGLFGVEMGPARHHQELRARGRPLQHQRQLRRARHGRRSALPRQGLRRHGASASASPSSEAVERHAADYALKRVTTDADVANACLFLASDVSRQITGVDLPVDGGWAML